jgi:heme a synthase
MLQTRFARYAWLVVGFNILVILWGAFVRVTGSGAGCGSHWPLCNGEVIPLAPQLETMIEFSHRLTSGLALFMVVGLLVWAFRAYPRGHHVRAGAVASMIFMLIEALIGAALVLLALVAENVSLSRAIALAIHLVNTFLLLAALTLTAWWASGRPPLVLRGRGTQIALLLPGLIGMLIIGSSGAITALGDTLLLQGVLPGGVNQVTHQSDHILVQLRVFHPIIGMLVGIYLLYMARALAQRLQTLVARRLNTALLVLFVVQIAIGGLNVTLQAPAAMQLVHLLMADLLWINLVLLGAEALAEPLPQTQRAQEAEFPAQVGLNRL